MYVIISKSGDKLLDSFVFSTEESANSYGKTHFFEGVWRVWELISYDSRR